MESELLTKIQPSELKKSGFAMIKSMPCRIIEIEHKAPATANGNKRIRLVGLHVFTNKKYEDTLNLTAGFTGIEVPITTKASYLLMDVELPDGTLSLLDEASGETKDDVSLIKDPEQPKGSDTPFDEIGNAIVKAFNDGTEARVTVLGIMGKDLVVEISTS
mmetsp:Transcript_114075/g.179581  ORF Transcript_114075/g.179581 Transcript_114075/m.179581 type:complete len:161 (-) Transcript_114075:24-506(-)